MLNLEEGESSATTAVKVGVVVGGDVGGGVGCVFIRVGLAIDNKELY